jgi:hypothetical protein
MCAVVYAPGRLSSFMNNERANVRYVTSCIGGLAAVHAWVDRLTY